MRSKYAFDRRKRDQAFVLAISSLPSITFGMNVENINETDRYNKEILAFVCVPQIVQQECFIATGTSSIHHEPPPLNSKYAFLSSASPLHLRNASQDFLSNQKMEEVLGFEL